jgi:hypothetical protein
MSATVYATAAGDRYHQTPYCQALAAMQHVNEQMGGMWVPGAPYMVSHAIAPATAEQAARDGKTPCSRCKPDLAVVADTFGHEPWFACLPAFTKGWACARCRVRARCVTVGSPEDDPSFHTETHAVPWPCTSAIVLGLTPREVTA